MASATLIEIQEIARQYTIGTETIHALKSVSLNIKKGEFVALMDLESQH